MKSLASKRLYAKQVSLVDMKYAYGFGVLTLIFVFVGLCYALMKFALLALAMGIVLCIGLFATGHYLYGGLLLGVPCLLAVLVWLSNKQKEA